MVSCDQLPSSIQITKLNCQSTNHLNLLSEIKNTYESIFAWDIYEKVEKLRNSPTEILNKVTEKEGLIFENNNKFNFDSMYLCLIRCYETFLNADFSQALSQIDDLVQILKYTKIDTFFQPISSACLHVIYATKAYIMAFLNENPQQILKDIKPYLSFNSVEKAAVYAIKSKVFLEYPYKGSKIALRLAEFARDFNSTENHWISIWLIAKGRQRRFDCDRTLPFRDELEAANKLCSCVDNPEFLLSASNVFLEAGLVLKIHKNKIYSNTVESKKYLELASNLILMVYRQARKDPININLLYNCLCLYTSFPKNFFHNYYAISDIVHKLSKKQNHRIDEVLGKFFMKIIKDYYMAKIYFTRGFIGESFSSSLLLLKVECLLDSDKNFPILLYLNFLYELYTCPMRRLIIVNQILLYYTYIEVNPKALINYLDIYLNQDIDYVQKKQQIMAAYPLYNVNQHFKPNTFFQVLSEKIQKLKMYPEWDFDRNKLKNIVLKFGRTRFPQRTEKNAENNLKCVVCFDDDAASIITKPCHHRCMCKVCWDVIKHEKPSLCPICRKKVVSILIC